MIDKRAKTIIFPEIELKFSTFIFNLSIFFHHFFEHSHNFLVIHF